MSLLPSLRKYLQKYTVPVPCSQLLQPFSQVFHIFPLWKISPLTQSYQDKDRSGLREDTAPWGAVEPEVLQPVEGEAEEAAGGHHGHQGEAEAPDAAAVPPHLHLVLRPRVQDHHTLQG